MPCHRLSNVEVMPPVAAPAMRGEAVVGFGQAGQDFEGYGLHWAGILELKQGDIPPVIIAGRYAESSV